ncbi:P-loop ATPase, Sll1717 family [Roseomonas genomospecies 6]|uniref:ATPase n=1 Tax=Roseomonas genomospecies 6 TaxID=214106 RepID=A0A9W7NLP9_9PROT|nr:ATPase [Roseomonas genomospecies 6]KAA0682410.1 ATPase [Roseomonas genomospecies 6]
MVKLLKEIDFGETDANAEWIISLRSNVEPLYVRAWSAPEINDYGAFLKGQKFIITGQKGTGKTAILRYMEREARREGYNTEFIVFKNEIIREAELLKIDSSNFNGAVVEEDKLRGGKFYYHAIKRIMVSLLISKLNDVKLSEDVPGKDLFEKLFSKTGKEALRIAFDSILNVVESSQVNVEKISKGILRVDPGYLLKKANDDLFSRAIRLARDQKAKIRLFFDEMHFAFRDKESLRSDASLVRDTILVVQALNERFAEEGLDIVVYIALRKEFLDQPEIAQADVVHVIESYGEAITWEHHPAAINHPVFDFITLRFKAAMGKNFSKTEMLETYLKEIDPLDLLDYTWSKPRDLVRFFKTAQSIDGNTVVIPNHKYKTIIRKYSAQAWQESKSALAAFMPTEALPLLEKGLKTLIPGQLDGSARTNLEKFQAAVKPAFAKAKAAGVKYDLSEFCGVLYMMGVFYYVYTDANGQFIYQQYHRGNINPTQSGEIRIHSAVAKALS